MPPFPNPTPHHTFSAAAEKPALDVIAHILQRAVEGGHWMLTPPHLLTLVHAVQQPMGLPGFTRLTVQREPEHAGPFHPRRA